MKCEWIMVDIGWMGKSSILASWTFRDHLFTDGFVYCISSAFGAGNVFGHQPDVEFRGSWDWAAMDGNRKHPNKSC